MWITALTTDSLRGQRAERPHPALDGRRRHRAGGQLDHERRRTGEAVVLPVRRRAVWPRDTPVRIAGEQREPARRGHALPPGANDALWLVKPDRDLRAQLLDQRHRVSRLRLRQRTRTRILEAPGPADLRPVRREVTVEVNAVSVPAGAAEAAVGIDARDGDDLRTGRRADRDEPPHDRVARGFAPVDAAHDEHAV